MTKQNIDQMKELDPLNLKFNLLLMMLQKSTLIKLSNPENIQLKNHKANLNIESAIQQIKIENLSEKQKKTLFRTYNTLQNMLSINMNYLFKNTLNSINFIGQYVIINNGRKLKKQLIFNMMALGKSLGIEGRILMKDFREQEKHTIIQQYKNSITNNKNNFKNGKTSIKPKFIIQTIQDLKEEPISSLAQLKCLETLINESENILYTNGYLLDKLKATKQINEFLFEIVENITKDLTLSLEEKENAFKDYEAMTKTLKETNAMLINDINVGNTRSKDQCNLIANKMQELEAKNTQKIKTFKTLIEKEKSQILIKEEAKILAEPKVSKSKAEMFREQEEKKGKNRKPIL